MLRTQKLLLFALFFAAIVHSVHAGPEDPKVLREIEQEIGPLKEQVFQNKARLHELKQAVLEGKITGSKALITFDNQAEGFFAFVDAEFYLDGELVKKVVRNPKGKAQTSITVLDSDVPAGEHTVSARIQYQGSDKSIYSAFTYFKDYKFKLATTEKFDVAYGKTSVVKMIALDKGYFKSEIQERLFMDVKVVQDWGNTDLNP